jgi:hypothetical protein
MQSLRYGIVCHLKQSREVDVSAGKEFARSNEVYHAVLVSLKKNGLGETEHKQDGPGALRVNRIQAEADQ